MIDGDVAIVTIRERLVKLIDEGHLNATYSDSDQSISFYVRDIRNGNTPILTLRLSNHRPEFQGYIRSEYELPSESNNVSIEFYKTKVNNNGHKVSDKMNNNIHPEDFKNLTPFAVSSYKYYPSTLEWADVDVIYDAILEYLQTKTYADPFMNTEKSANTQTKVSSARRLKYAVPQNITYWYGDTPQAANILTNGADSVSEAFERRLNRIITETLNRVIRESILAENRKRKML